MRFGFIATEGGTYYQEFLEEILLGEALGFDSVWLEEHHGVRDHHWPSPLVGLAGIATRAEHVQLGTDVAVLPFYHPVRLADEAASEPGGAGTPMARIPRIFVHQAILRGDDANKRCRSLISAHVQTSLGCRRMTLALVTA